MFANPRTSVFRYMCGSFGRLYDHVHLVLRKIRPENAPSYKGKGKKKADAGDAKGHTDEVLTLAASADGRYLVSGGKDRRVVVWDVEKGSWVQNFKGHRDTISALTFRKGSLQLYSASFDRTIKLFDLSVMGYVETLFGHQDPILDLDALRAETAVSVGGRDGTVRFWKIADETQLVFRGGAKSALHEVLDGGLDGLDEEEDRRPSEQTFVEGSIECVAMVDDSTFVSGGDSGSLCLWMTHKKKPQFIQAVAHGLHQEHSNTEGVISTPRWITSVACLRYSDLIASGSWEGEIRLWKVGIAERKFTHVGSVRAPGFINSLQLLSSPDCSLEKSWVNAEEGALNGAGDQNGDGGRVLVVAGVGQEHRFGRWLKVKEGGAVNGCYIFSIRTR